jgi:hypothetical protein
MHAAVGSRGNLAFRYRVEDSDPNKVKATKGIALGGKVDVIASKIKSAGAPKKDHSQPRWLGVPEIVNIAATEEVALSKVVSRNEKVLSVVEMKGVVVTLEGHAPGGAQVDFYADGVSDSFDFIVAPVHRVEIGHSAAMAASKHRFIPQFVFLQGGTARFAVQRFSELGFPLLGYNVPSDISVVPPEAAILSTEDGDYKHINLHFKKTGTIELKPKNSTTLEIEVVELGSVDHIKLEPLQSEFREMFKERITFRFRVSESRYFLLNAFLGNGKLALGTVGLAAVTSEHGDVCQVISEKRDYGDNLYRIKALKVGKCLVMAKLGDRLDEVHLVVDPKKK